MRGEAKLKIDLGFIIGRLSPVSDRVWRQSGARCIANLIRMSPVGMVPDLGPSLDARGYGRLVTAACHTMRVFLFVPAGHCTTPFLCPLGMLTRRLLGITVLVVSSFATPPATFGWAIAGTIKGPWIEVDTLGGLTAHCMCATSMKLNQLAAR